MCHFLQRAFLYICPDRQAFSVKLLKRPIYPSVIGLTIQVYAPTSNTEEAEVEWFYEDRQDLLETPKKDVFFITGDWNAKVGSK